MPSAHPPIPVRLGLPRRVAAVALGLLCVLAVGGGTASADVAGGIDLGGLRPGMTPGAMNGDLNLAHAASASLVRFEAPWQLLQPSARGQFDPTALATLDSVVDGAAQRGMRVMLTVDGSPCWASSAPPSLLGGCSASSPATAYPPSDPADYASMAHALVARYGNRLAAFEVWNEPDHVNELYFAGPDKPTHYAAILRAAYPAIKSADPIVTVLAGSLVGANGAFLQALYAAGIKGYYDAISVHYYDLVLASLRSIRAVMTAAGDHSPVWLAEFGWTSCFPASTTQGGHSCVTPASEAADLADTLGLLPAAGWVDAAFVYNLHDTAQYQFGLVDRGGARKPAFAAVRTAFAGARHVRPVRLRLARRGGRLVASGSGPAGDALELDAFRGGVQKLKVTFSLDRNNHYRIPLPPALGTRGVRVRVYQYWEGVARGAHRRG